MTFEHEGNFYIANLQIYYIAIVNATEPLLLLFTYFKKAFISSKKFDKPPDEVTIRGIG